MMEYLIFFPDDLAVIRDEFDNTYGCRAYQYVQIRDVAIRICKRLGAVVTGESIDYLAMTVAIDSDRVTELSNWLWFAFPGIVVAPSPENLSLTRRLDVVQ